LKRPKSHQIDTKAQRILDSKLPSNWVKREKTPDYGVDYEIEVFDDEEPTGIWFTIQLKGTERLKEDVNYVSFPLKTDTIKYYFSKVPLPIFLFITSVKENKIYWLFIQRYVNEVLNIENPNWTKQKNVTIKIPKENIFNDVSIRKIESEAKEGREYTYLLQCGAPSWQLSLKINGAICDVNKLEEESRKHFVEQNEIDLNLATRYYEKDQLEKSKQKFLEIFERTKDRKDCAYEHLSSITGILTFYSPEEQEHTSEILKLSSYGYRLATKTNNKRFMFYFKGLFLEAEYYNILNPFIYNKMFQQIVKGTESNSIIDQTTSGLLGFIDLNYYNNLVEIFQQYAQNLNNSFKDKEYIISLDLSGRLIYLNLFTYASLVSENTKEKFDNTLKNISAIIDSCITLASALSCTGRLCENLKYKAIMLYYLGDDKYKDILKYLKALATEEQLSYYVRRSDELLRTFEEFGPFAESLNKGQIASNFEEELSDEEIDGLHRKLAKMAGIDLERDDEIARIVKIGLKDRNPERVLRNCSYLEIAIGSYGIYGSLLSLPTCGFKVLFCKHAKEMLEGLDLDMLYLFFKQRCCDKCNSCKPMSNSWKWSPSWQQETDKNRTEEFKRALEARNKV
jgi:hypothetical protein